MPWRSNRKSMNAGSLCRYKKNEYVIVIKKHSESKIDRVATYQVILPDGTIDVIPSSLLETIT